MDAEVMCIYPKKTLSFTSWKQRFGPWEIQVAVAPMAASTDSSNDDSPPVEWPQGYHDPFLSSIFDKISKYDALELVPLIQLLDTYVSVEEAAADHVRTQAVKALKGRIEKAVMGSAIEPSKGDGNDGHSSVFMIENISEDCISEKHQQPVDVPDADANDTVVTHPTTAFPTIAPAPQTIASPVPACPHPTAEYRGPPPQDRPIDFAQPTAVPAWQGNRFQQNITVLNNNTYNGTAPTSAPAPAPTIATTSQDAVVFGTPQTGAHQHQCTTSQEIAHIQQQIAFQQQWAQGVNLVPHHLVSHVGASPEQFWNSIILTACPPVDPRSFPMSQISRD
ncbi:hypothetical protein AYO20_08416 [Fonsecaea nubica]|uniref:Uncharacterized protein n=1 Tax=Fonsecaea nubica TaxID=856822 RepID=A0A178CQ89_9EURO|nr:hypothetical protein AYO20_08416 [Fonsecaea nubica]OAL31085.1 hypothetical protein AYO20_08416 [Fonsecaea nubica]